MKFKTLSIKRKDVLYDVNFISWKTAKCRITEPQARAEVQTDDENLIWFERMLATAVDHLKGRLRWCIAEPSGTITDNSIKMKAVPYGDNDNPAVEQDFNSFVDDELFIEAPADKIEPFDEHIVRFKFSDSWRGDFNTFTNYVHRYIVDYILYEWFKITMPNEASAYLMSADAWESKVVNEARSEDVSNVFFRL